MALEEISFPVPIAAAEQPEVEQSTASWVRHCIDLVKLDGDHLGKEGLVGVVYHATTLNDVNRRIFHKALSGPTRVVGVWEVIAVEDGDDISASVELEEVVEVISFGFGAWDVCDGELWVLFFHLHQLGLERLDGLWCVVD